MKKNYIKLTALFFAAVLLAALYFFIIPENENGNNEENLEAFEENMVKITDGDYEKLSSVILNEKEETVEIIRTENGNFVIKGCEDIKLNDENTESFVKSMASISGKEVEGVKEEPSKYGFSEDGKRVILEFDDKSRQIVYVGGYTPDGEYCYVKKQDDDKIYMTDYINGKRACYTINDFIDKELPIVSPYSIQLLNIKRKGKEEIDITYNREKEGNAKELISMGMETMYMNKPYKGMAVYPTNLQDTVLLNIQSIQLGDVADTSLKNIGKFGLDFPTAEINLSDSENSFKMLVGNKADENNYYCIVNDKNAVFFIDKKYVEPFINADPIKFIEKFVSIHYRADLLKAEMSGNGESYEITFGEDTNDKTEETEDGKSRFSDDRKVYINGKEIEKSEFAEFFELLAGITFDRIDENAKPLSENPEAVIKYTLKDGQTEEIRFLPFNDSFYIAEGGKADGMLVSRLKVKKPFESAGKIVGK